MRGVGVDIGSTYTKYCLLDGQWPPALGTEPTPVRQREHFEARLAQLERALPGAAIVTCGYGRDNLAGRSRVTELVALARGAGRACPDARLILDVGGQDTKLVLQEGGALRRFYVNDRCAAGCGIFLRNTLSMLGIPFGEVSLVGAGPPEASLSSVCAVFAQTEIVERIAEGADEDSLVRAVVAHILTQAATLLAKCDPAPVALSGGLSLIPGIDEFATRVLARPVSVAPLGDHLSAIGCALIAAGIEGDGRVPAPTGLGAGTQADDATRTT